MSGDLKIVVRNISGSPMRFEAWIYRKVNTGFSDAKGNPLRKLEKVSSLVDSNTTENGAVAEIAIPWNYDFKPMPPDVYWKAPPEQSQKWEILEWTWKGQSIVEASSEGQTRVFA